MEHFLMGSVDEVKKKKKKSPGVLWRTLCGFRFGPRRSSDAK